VELREIYATMLGGTDLEIEPAYDGVEAMERLAHAVPDALVLDIILDEMMGDALYREIQRDPRLDNVPIVVVSVLSAERARTLLDMDARTFFLRKPFRRAALLDILQRALRTGHGGGQG
jgi:CheY-like chemotaxis protein